MINSCVVAALYAADTIFLVTNPDVPSIRNAQRWSSASASSAPAASAIKILLNRVSDQHLIAPKQIETALGCGIHHTFSSDYRTVSTALNSGVPLADDEPHRARGAVRQLHAAACVACRTTRGRAREEAARRSSAYSDRSGDCMTIANRRPTTPPRRCRRAPAVTSSSGERPPASCSTG